MYLEATGEEPGYSCRLVSPMLPEDGLEKCLKFSFNAYGLHPGALRVLDEISTILWQFVGHIVNSSGEATVTAKFYKCTLY